MNSRGRVALTGFIIIYFVGALSYVSYVVFSQNRNIAKASEPVHQYYPFDKITTKGNHTYLPINMTISPAYNGLNDAGDLLDFLRQFELRHPELEVTNWHADHNSMGGYYALWIDHRPK